MQKRRIFTGTPDTRDHVPLAPPPPPVLTACQMRDMLESIGVRRLGPAEASLLLDKRLKGDRLAALGYLSAAAGAAGDRGGGGEVVVGGGGRAAEAEAPREMAISSFG